MMVMIGMTHDAHEISDEDTISDFAIDFDSDVLADVNIRAHLQRTWGPEHRPGADVKTLTDCDIRTNRQALEDSILDSLEHAN